MLFGSELFEPIVGEFLIAAATSKGRELSEKEINLMQVRQQYSFGVHRCTAGTCVFCGHRSGASY
jgi:hypothetical protein